MPIKSPPYTVVKDSREQEGYTFERFTGRYTSCNGMIVKKLDTGDYSLLGLEDKLCIERKAKVSELAINLGKDKYRFLKEIERMEKFPFKFIILEFSLDDLMKFPEGSDIPEDKWDSMKITNKYILKMLIEFQMYNGIHVLFCNDRKNAKLIINSILKRVNEHYSIGRKRMSITLDNISDIHTYGLDVKNREVYLHGYIGNTDDDMGVEHKMASIFYKNIRLLDTISNEPIIIHMHSRGGNWNDGMTIYDSIIMCKSHITLIVYGQAESMSSIILQAADKRVMMPNSYFMCHFGSTGLSGSYLDVQQAANYEKETVNKMIDIYTDVCINGKYFKERYGQSPDRDKVKNFLKRKFKDGDWYLNANDTVYYGFADCILNTKNYKNIESLK